MATSRALPKALNILLVEPNADVQEAFSAVLSCVGYTVEVAACGSEALEIARRHPPDVVLSELSLTDMSGRELYTRLRSRSETRSCKFVAVTAYCDNEYKEELLTVGFDLVLLKPVFLKGIVEVLTPMASAQRPWRSPTESPVQL